MSWLLIVVIVFFALMGFSGYQNGAVKTFLSLGVIIGALIIAMLAGPALKRVSCENTEIDEKLSNKIETKMTESIAQEADIELKINSMHLPKFIKKILLANLEGTNNAFEAGVRKGSEAVASMILVLTFALITFLVAWGVIALIVHQLTKAMELPVLKQLDGIAGILVNLAIALLVLDIGFLILDCVSMTSAGMYLTKLVEKSKVLTALSDKNIVAMIFNSFMAELEI